jgi:hypothetical protein
MAGALSTFLVKANMGRQSQVGGRAGGRAGLAAVQLLLGLSASAAVPA